MAHPELIEEIIVKIYFINLSSNLTDCFGHVAIGKKEFAKVIKRAMISRFVDGADWSVILRANSVATSVTFKGCDKWF